MLDFLSVRINSFLAVKPMQPRTALHQRCWVFYVTAKAAVSNKFLLHTTDTHASCAPARRDVDRVFLPVGALVSSRRFTEGNNNSCCGYSVVDAIHHFETGEGPVDLF